MNYSMKVNQTLAPQGINLRSGPATTNADIGDLNIGSIAEGDEMVTDASHRKWLNVLMIDGMQVSQPTFAASWLCDVTENPTLPPSPTVQVDLTFVSETPITIIANGIPVGVYTGTIALVAKG